MEAPRGCRLLTGEVLIASHRVQIHPAGWLALVAPKTSVMPT